MSTYRPPHPGEFARDAYIVPYNICVSKVAACLQLPLTALNSLLNGETRISPEMAERLSRALGRSPESWLAMQNEHDLWHTGGNNRAA